MTGTFQYSTTPSENINANTGITWDEGMSPALVNNSARQNMTDLRLALNDLAWFQYGSGSKAPAPTYSSGTVFTQASGSSLSSVYHVGRRVKAVGSSTGTIYGTISATSYSASTQTVTVAWDSGSLSNESLTVYLSQIPVTGYPSMLGVNTIAQNGSLTLPGGLILKWGLDATTTATSAITFPTAFPNNCWVAIASVDSGSPNYCATVISDKTAFTIYKSSTSFAYWFAVGN